MGRIGIYGGTFNPPPSRTHAGGTAGVELLNLDKLLLIPDHAPPHKTMPEGTPAAQERLELVRLTAREIPGRRPRTWSFCGRAEATPPIRWSCCTEPIPVTSCFCSWARICF
ncbi:MAG: hypothetical protein ACLSHU_06365 [Oscillospiraceae bacterium]